MITPYANFELHQMKSQNIGLPEGKYHFAKFGFCNFKDKGVTAEGRNHPPWQARDRKSQDL